ncbi:hypothetical protein ASE40_18485 [Flavobacterium sp. Root935]|jgi:hypothetical protein|uniref:hypothetical protein n=1 Tax=unclassified Flavobacterium TaxID=196869 RepID=UPI00070BBB8B|nr:MULTISPECIES: hypothetical protein [unclassified Flavobacterium]KRD58322.1 hypothetical protein ASE40_18485 [Flavobacterium sp. Root935]TDX11648.1 hypothetical protein EDB96_2439 [Flavobacterium sp. S87F.05.LMB.W.Kidney.N]
MKKYASLLLFAFLLNGCDDGDLTVETIDFESVTTSQACDPLTNTLIYKLKNQEALLLQLPETAGIVNDPGTYEYPIDSKGNGQYRVVYRAYDGAVATANICGAIPPSTPKVTEEWLATDGIITIETSQIEKPNTTDDGSRITGYDHSIIIKNVTFAKPSGNQTQAQYVFGTYSTTVTPASLVFKTNTNGTAYECGDLKKVYNYNNSFYLTIDDIDPALIVNTDTPANQPRTSLITASMNKVYYRTAKAETGSFSEAYICNPTSTPAIDETWSGQLGVAGTSGIIEVTTTHVAQVYTHTIVLRNVILEKGNSHFKLGSRFLLGNIERTVN